MDVDEVMSSGQQGTSATRRLVGVISFLQWSVSSGAVSSAECNDAFNPPADCCELDPYNECFIAGITTAMQSHCSVACQKRYETLGWECYNPYHMNVQWRLMEQLCDPQGVITFVPPVTTRSPAAIPFGAVSSARCTDCVAVI